MSASQSNYSSSLSPPPVNEDYSIQSSFSTYHAAPQTRTSEPSGHKTAAAMDFIRLDRSLGRSAAGVTATCCILDAQTTTPAPLSIKRRTRSQKLPDRYTFACDSDIRAERSGEVIAWFSEKRTEVVFRVLKHDEYACVFMEGSCSSVIPIFVNDAVRFSTSSRGSPDASRWLRPPDALASNLVSPANSTATRFSTLGSSYPTSTFIARYHLVSTSAL
jgi:hypothetical protein